MRKLYVGFAKRRGFNVVSELIKLVEGTPYSHVYCRFHSDNLDRDVIYQASGTQVAFRAMHLFQGEESVVTEFEVEVSDERYTKIMQFCLDTVGTPYGLKSMIGFLFVYAARLFGKTIPNPFRDGRATYVCSELGDVILAESGYSPPDEDSATPKVLYAYMQGKFKVSDGTAQ